MKITASYSRKLNHATYGGEQFENSDHGASIEIEIPDNETPVEDIKHLQNEVKSVVEEKIVEEMMELGGGLHRLEFNKILDNYIRGGSMKEEEYHKMSPFQQRVIQIIKRHKKRI